ncbi:ENT domain [Sesbania bispinosa]|nr:ENT domain [Sesbania bispinosa]
MAAHVMSIASSLQFEPRGIRDAVDLGHHVHCLETEAYNSVLKAFIAQSDLLTWGKEELMTELRKELNVTDVEHGEILMKINSDESIKWIREQRKLASHTQDYIKANTPSLPSASMRSSVIKLKTPSSAAFYPQKNMSSSQASHISIPIPSSMPPKFISDPLTAEFAHGKAEQSMEMFNYNVQLPPIGRGGVQKGKYPLKKYIHTSESLKLKNRSDIIEIRATDKVIHDVEKMLFSREKPDPIDIERAKWTLREQERALLEALGKLADVLERDDASNQMQCYEISKNTSGRQEMMMHANVGGLMGRFNGLGGSF